MRFEVEGDNPAILKALEAYRSVFNTEYQTQIKAAREKLSVLGMGSSMNALPDQLDMFFWEESGKVVISLPVHTPKIIKVLKRDKHLAGNFQKFLEAQGVYVKSCKHTGD
jgi:hypothetical protein